MVTDEWETTARQFQSFFDGAQVMASIGMTADPMVSVFESIDAPGSVQGAAGKWSVKEQPRRPYRSAARLWQGPCHLADRPLAGGRQALLPGATALNVELVGPATSALGCGRAVQV